MNGYVYLIRPPMSVKTNVAIYKIGMSSKQTLDRLKSYGKDMHILACAGCADPRAVEQELLERFNANYILFDRNEYFKGDAALMIQDFYDIVFTPPVKLTRKLKVKKARIKKTQISDKPISPAVDEFSDRFTNERNRHIIRFKFKKECVREKTFEITFDDDSQVVMSIEYFKTCDFRHFTKLKVFSLHGNHKLPSKQIYLPQSVEYIDWSSTSRAATINWEDLTNLKQVRLVKNKKIPKRLELADSVYVVYVSRSHRTRLNIDALPRLMLLNGKLYVSSEHEIKSRLLTFTSAELQHAARVAEIRGRTKMNKDVLSTKLSEIIINQPNILRRLVDH